MRLYHGTRRRVMWPCMTLLLITCFYLLLTSKRTYTPEEARSIFHQMTLQRASEAEIVSFFECQSKLVLNPVSNQKEYKYYFTNESIFQAEVTEAWPIFDDNKQLKYWVCSTEMLQGTKLWKYRLERLLQHIGA